MTETPIFDALRQSRPLPKVDEAANRAAENLTRTLEELANLGLRGLSRGREAADQRPDTSRTATTVTPIPRQVDKEQAEADTQSRAVAAS